MLQVLKNQFIKVFILIVFLSTKGGLLIAGESEHSGEKFNAGELIIEHVADNHEWHIMGKGEHSISLPLPIIIYSSQSGLHCFMSSNFHHGTMTHQGFKMEKGKVVAVNETETIAANTATINEELTNSLTDISITKNVLALFVSLIILVWMFLSVAKSYVRRKDQAPKGLQSLLEPLIIFVRDDIAKTNIGPKYQKYLPYLLTVFFFIFLNNLLGLIPILPGGANVTGNLAVTATLAVITFLITTFSANKHYWHHVFAMPGVPKWVLIILTPIEILQLFLRPFVLMIRLFANITAGHIIALSFFSIIFIFGEMSTGAGYGASVVSVAFVIFMSLLELLVAFLQAYVFTLLSAMYFGAALEEHDNHESHKSIEHIEEAALV